MHVPFALTPLAADYLLALGAGMNDRYDWYGFPQRWRTAVWNGYGYFAFTFDGGEGEFERSASAGTSTGGTGSTGPAIGGGPRRCPSCARSTSGSATSTSTGCRATHSPWPGRTPGRPVAGPGRSTSSRSWVPTRSVEDLADLYERRDARRAAERGDGADPGLRRRPVRGRARVGGAGGDGRRHAGRGGEAARRRSRVARASCWTLDGGPAFVARLDAFLAEHGHLGQPCDDSRSRRGSRSPACYLAELAKRIDRPASPRRGASCRGCAAEADALADAGASRLADRPDELAELRAPARRSPATSARSPRATTTGSTGWPSRALRQLSMRVGRRLAAEGSIERDDDVLFLDRAEVAAVLVAPGTSVRSSPSGARDTPGSSEIRPPTLRRQGADRGRRSPTGSMAPARWPRRRRAPRHGRLGRGSCAGRPGSHWARRTSAASSPATSSCARRRTRRGCRCSRSPAAS